VDAAVQIDDQSQRKQLPDHKNRQTDANQDVDLLYLGHEVVE